MWLTGSLFRVAAIPLLLWLSLPFNLLIYGVNDVFDRDVDARSARKGGIEGARIDDADVRPIAIAVVATNVPFLAWFVATTSATTVAWLAAYASIFVGYSVPPVRFKARPFLDSVSNAAYAFPLVFVPYALGSRPVWPAAIGLMTWAMAKHTYDAIQDVEDDRAVGLRTTVVVLGIKPTLLWCGLWWSVSTWFFLQLSWSVALASFAIAAALVIGVATRPTADRAHALYRFSIAYPYVAGTVAGVQLAIAVVFGWWRP
jgi:4-hydroxybenzoate polyprenyltransferase